MAKRLGVTHPINPANYSLSIGVSDGVSPLDMATVFATFAADGVRHDPVFIKRVEDSSGKVIFEDKGEGVRAIDPQIARTVTDVLRGVITEGTGTRAELDDQVAAGKTGHHRREERRLVRRLHARSSSPRCGWATRSSADAMNQRRPLQPGLRRHVAGDRLEEVHVARARRPARGAVHPARRGAVAVRALRLARTAAARPSYTPGAARSTQPRRPRRRRSSAFPPAAARRRPRRPRQPPAPTAERRPTTHRRSPAAAVSRDEATGRLGLDEFARAASRGPGARLGRRGSAAPPGDAPRARGARPGRGRGRRARAPARRRPRPPRRGRPRGEAARRRERGRHRPRSKRSRRRCTRARSARRASCRRCRPTSSSWAGTSGRSRTASSS